MKVVLSHPTGNSNVRAVLAGLAGAGMLAEFSTTLAANSNSWWLQFLPSGVRQEWLRRAFPIPITQIRTHPYLELLRMVSSRLGLHYYIRHEVGVASIDAVYQGLDKEVARRLSRLAKKEEIGAVYAYEDGALETFMKAKELGIKCIYDLPIAYWETGRRLMLEEAERLPNWERTLGGGTKDSPAKLERKACELGLADLVVTPSQFVMDSLPHWAINKQTVMAPFGSPAATEDECHPVSCERKNGRGPLRVLFVGSMGQRKGLGDLFAAMQLLNRADVELVVMGSALAPMDFYRSECHDFIYEQGRPHDQVLALMRTCDVFCLPSIVEGRALVMQEAMSQGLPLIITPNTGGADLVKEGQTGFLIPIRSPEAIAEKLSWFLKNRSETVRMGIVAKEHALRYTWERYSNQIAQALATNLN